MKFADFSARQARNVAALTLCLAVAIFTRVPAHAQQPGQPIFEPGFEGEIWKTRPPNPIGHRVTPPCILEEEWVYDEDLGYFTAANGNHCTPEQMFNEPARDAEMLFPTGVAVYDPTPESLANGFPTQKRVFVADRYNHRILTFVSAGNGNWTALRLPDADWNGFNSPYTLTFPEHIAVDAGGYLWVTDLEGARIVVFSPEGEGLKSIPLSSRGPTDDEELVLLPYGIAVAPGSQYGVASGRVAVIAQEYHDGGTELLVLDTENGAEVGRHAPDPRDEEDDPNDQFDSPGELFNATAVGYHREDLGGGQYVDRLVVADTNNNRIQVFPTAPNGAPMPVPVLTFGATALVDANNAPVYESVLQWPYSLLVDHRGRVLVSDSIGNRLTVFKVDFSGQPKAQFLFELNSRGGLNGVPRGIAEDSSHTLYVVDTGDHEVEVFEIPELAIVDVSALPETSQVGDVITVEFSVMVPETKSTVPDVMPSCVGSAGLTYVSGPTWIMGTPAGLPKTMHSVTTDGVYRYSCSFTTAVSGPFNVTLGASSPGGTVAAPTKLAVGRVSSCSGNCAPTVSAVVAASDGSTPQNGYYRSNVDITITATDHGAGKKSVRRIYWRWLRGGAMSNYPLTHTCPGYTEGEIQCADIVPATPTASFLVEAGLNGASTLEFWAEDADDNWSPRTRVTIRIDRQDPEAEFRRQLKPTGADLWWNVPVRFDLIYTDDQTPQSQIRTTPLGVTKVILNGEGRNLVGSITLTDLAGNTATYDSSEYVINIDKTAPVTTVMAGAIALTNNASLQATLATLPTLNLTNADPILSNGDAPSGVVSSSYTLDGTPTTFIGATSIVGIGLGPHTLVASSRDKAGNIETKTLNFYVNAPPIAGPVTGMTARSVPVTLAPSVTDANDRATDPLTLSIVSNALSTQGSAAIVNGQIVFTPNATFLGTATFTYRATDAHGGMSTPATVTVTVNAIPGQNQPPTCGNAAPSTGLIWPPNHKLVTVSILGVQDPDSDPLNIQIVSIYQDESTNTRGDGNTPIDAYGVGTAKAQVRAERSGLGDGRFYHISFTATDPEGGSCSGTVKVVVPHDQGKNKPAPVDGGALFPSTGS